jgi:glutamine cyclotransferase
MTFLVVLLPALLLTLSCSRSEEAFSTKAPIYDYRVINVFPHDSLAYTQGLAFDQGVLYESVGLRGRSALRRVSLETGEVLLSRKLADDLFAEGIALVDDRIVQLTWLLRIGFVWDKETFQLLDEFHFPTEGWGLAYDGRRLIMSDGSPVLHFLDPATLMRTGRIRVTDGGKPVTRLNELEYIDGEVYANVWQTDRIARIDPTSGEVRGWLQLEGIYPQQDTSEGSLTRLNGIAYDSTADRLFVTGKMWPYLYEIELIPTQ